MVFCNILDVEQTNRLLGHNPYFNRWFSAIIEDFLGGCILEIVTILILIDGFLQYSVIVRFGQSDLVTILILIDGFLQLLPQNEDSIDDYSHNPYFNRWFSAIKKKKLIKE